MTGKILPFADYLRAIDEHPDEVPDVDRDKFLLEEGLDLLASYRSIRNRSIRLKLKTLVELIAKGQP